MIDATKVSLSKSLAKLWIILRLKITEEMLSFVIIQFLVLRIILYDRFMKQGSLEDINVLVGQSCLTL